MPLLVIIYPPLHTVLVLEPLATTVSNISYIKNNTKSYLFIKLHNKFILCKSKLPWASA